MWSALNNRLVRSTYEYELQAKADASGTLALHEAATESIATTARGRMVLYSVNECPVSFRAICNSTGIEPWPICTSLYHILCDA
jgi:hypothetical protein